MFVTHTCAAEEWVKKFQLQVPITVLQVYNISLVNTCISHFGVASWQVMLHAQHTAVMLLPG